MAQKNWKEKLNDMGIEIKEVRRTDGSVIDGWYTFEHKGLPVFTYAMNNQRTYQVGVPPFPPYADEYKSDVKGRFACTKFDHFMEHIEDFVADSPGNQRIAEKFKETIKMPESWKNFSKKAKSSAQPNV